MEWLLEAGPFEAHDGEGRLLFSDTVVRLPAATAVVLDGPSGSGKSTLLRHVTGLTHGSGSSGSGTDARTLKGEPFQGELMPMWRTRVTLVAQDAPMLPGSLRHNLEFPYRFRCAGKRTFDVDRARSLMDEVGLEIPVDPAVLVADEPLSGLDADAAATCFELLLGFAHRPGHALLAVLHHRELGARADAKMHLEEGRLGGA
jgi:ABC-type lipoprotein export system ATPase subunit